MKIQATALILACTALAGCGSIRLVPPAEVPSKAVGVPVDPDWHPYSSGPMQAATPGITSGIRGSSGGPASPSRKPTVSRTALPDVTPGMTEAVTTSDVPETVTDGSTSTSGPQTDAWKPYSAAKSGRTQATPSSVFGRGVSSSWAKEYVPESHRAEFGIFAVKAASDGQARMVMPTGEVYSASVVRRNGPCSTIEIGVTVGGDLPIIARGPAEVCR